MLSQRFNCSGSKNRQLDQVTPTQPEEPAVSPYVTAQGQLTPSQKPAQTRTTSSRPPKHFCFLHPGPRMQLALLIGLSLPSNQRLLGQDMSSLPIWDPPSRLKVFL